MRQPAGNSERLTAQEQVVLNILAAVYPEGMTRHELIDAMVGVVRTKTSYNKVLYYTQQTLLKYGLIDIIDTSTNRSIIGRPDDPRKYLVFDPII